MAETMSSNSCRICMSSKMHHSSIFSNDLSRKITEIADVEVQEGDGLPPTICEDCEVDLDKCYKFRVQIQWADSKFRENLSVSEVVFEECQIKQEIAPMHPFMNEDNQDNEDDDDDRGPSDNDDDDYDMREEPEDKTENADKEGNQVTHPLDHVEIIENRTKQEIHMPLTDQNSQEEPLIVAQNMKSENEPTTDPLMHNEPQSMETDNILPGPSTSAPMVYGTEKTKWLHKRARPDVKPESSTETRPPSDRTEQIQDMLDEISHFMIDNEDEKSEGESDSDEEPSPAKQPKIEVVTKQIKKQSKKSPLKTRQRKGTLKSKDEDKLFKTHDSSTCFVCNVSCGDYDLLQEHFSSKHFFCRVCTEEFSNHLELETHLLTNHIIHKCKGCSNVYFTKKDYLQHRKSSESCIKETYQCEVCDKVFWKKKYLRLHRAKAHSVGSLKCGICSKTFSLAHILTSHLKAVHPVFENLECSFCKKLFLGPENLKKHVKLKHVEPLENSTFICEVCSKVFTNENLYKQHFKTHDKTEVLCELCGKSAAGQAAMKLHKRHDHPKSRIYTCSLCPMQFDSYNKYCNHKRNYHKDPNKEQPAYCEICGKKFKSTTVLKRHLLIHSDERTFKCNICGASFKQQVALYTHSRTHSDVNNYSCFQCGMTFRWKQTFDKHVKKCHEHPHYLDLS